MKKYPKDQGQWREGGSMPTNDLRLTRIPVVQIGMPIRRSLGEVFRAFADPTVTTRFWFAKSTGPLKRDATVQWEWEAQGHSTRVRVLDVEEDRLIRFEWNGKAQTTVEFRFVPWEEEFTNVQITETGLRGDADELVAHVAGSAAGFAQVLCAAKVLLEHDVELNVVRDQGLVRQSMPEARL
jgi:uncharacterized protein YndB with AHSA1/START domain